MRILDIHPWWSAITYSGSSVRINNLLVRLADSFEVRQFAIPREIKLHSYPRTEHRKLAGKIDIYIYHNPAVCALNSIPIRRWPHNPVLAGIALKIADPRKLRELLRWADLIVVEYPYAFEFIKERTSSKPIVLSAHNVEATKLRSRAELAGIRPERSFFFRHGCRCEAYAVQHADLIVAVSEQDGQEFCRRYRIPEEKVLTVVNGADVHQLRPATPTEKQELKRKLGLGEKPVVLFLGGGNPGNRRGLRDIYRMAELGPEFTFLVVGRVCQKPRRHGNIIETGVVEDITQYVRAADYSVCPVIQIGGTKVKVTESLAAGLPAVIYRESLEGMELEPEVHVIVTETTPESALAALRRLLANPALTEQLARAARRVACERYNWDLAAETLKWALQELAARPTE